MTRSYIKLDPDLPDRKDYYPDGAFRALVIVFCTASHQPRPGYFRSERLLKALLGRHAKHIPFLLEERDLEPAEDGYHVVGWEAWQEGKYPTVEARMAAIRGRRRSMTPAERAFSYRQRKKSEAGDTENDVTTSKLDVKSDEVRRDASRHESDAPAAPSRFRAQSGVTERDDRHEADGYRRDASRDEWSDRTVPNPTEPDAAASAAATTDQDQERTTTTSEFQKKVERPRLLGRTA